MNSTLTGHRGSNPAVILESAVSELRSVVPFDAIQLIRHEPRRAELSEVLRAGYEVDAAWALQHLFTEKYRVGFTGVLSPNDGLPPAISSVRSEFREEFVESRIFRDHLGVHGFRDGMSMELFLGDSYVGIAHFSARAQVGFDEHARRVAAGVQGLLAALVVGVGTSLATLPTPASTVIASDPRWYAFAGPRGVRPRGAAPTPAALTSRSFQAHLAQFRDSGLPAAQHLWAHEDQLSRVELRRIDDAGEVVVGLSAAKPEEYHRLTAQELRVLTMLCAGQDDASMARALHLSRRTVESHVLHIRRKLGAGNRVEAVVRALTTASFLPDPKLCPLTRILGSAARP